MTRYGVIDEFQRQTLFRMTEKLLSIDKVDSLYMTVKFHVKRQNILTILIYIEFRFKRKKCIIILLLIKGI